MRKRFLPVYFLKMARMLKQGTPRQQILVEMGKKHGIPKATVSYYLSTAFPKKRAATPEAVDALLWKKREAILSSFDRSKIALKAAAALSPAQRRERALRREAALSPEQRRKRSEKGLEAIAALSPEQRRERALKAAAALSPEQRRERGLKGAAALSPEQRRERGLKGAAALSPAQRRERALKAAVSRRKNIFGDAKYVENLPVLNLLGEVERNNLYEKHFEVIDAAVKKFRRRPDFGDVQGTADLAFFVALTKWDRKVDLLKLIRDQIKYDLIVYFSEEKRHARTELPFDERFAGKPKRRKG